LPEGQGPGWEVQAEELVQKKTVEQWALSTAWRSRVM